MRGIRSLAALALFLTFVACTSTTAKVEEKEDLLAASGFVIRPATTAKRLAMLHHLPPHHFVQRVKGNKVIFLYADPLVCNCLYIGDSKAYGMYQETILARQVIRENQADNGQLRDESLSDLNFDLKAIELEDSAWDWGPWGPGWW